MVDELAIGTPRDEDLQAVAGEAVTVEVLLHGERGAEQADGRQSGSVHRGCRGIGQVQQRNRHGVGDRAGHLVHGVGAEQEHVGTSRLERARC